MESARKTLHGKAKRYGQIEQPFGGENQGTQLILRRFGFVFEFTAQRVN
jgi:hypothetical protein